MDGIERTGLLAETAGNTSNRAGNLRVFADIPGATGNIDAVCYWNK